MEIMKHAMMMYVRMFNKKVIRFVPMILLATLLPYVLYHAQDDLQMVISQEVRNQFPVASVRAVSSFPNVSVFPSLNKTQNTTPKNVKSVSNTTVSPKSHPAIHFPLDIDLKKIIDDKIENNINITVKPINEHGYEYIHRSPKCSFPNMTENITMLILVKSSVKNVFLRDAIRNTWGADLSKNIVLRFMLGFSVSHAEQTKLEDETYQDVIVENFVDTYANNTLKTIMGFNWAVNECPTARAILFIDEDHLPRIDNIMDFLRSFNPKQLDSLFCGIQIIMGRAIRRKHRWSVPENVYQHKHWPPYLRGGSYVVSQKIAKRFTLAFPFVKYIHIDDSYLGIVALKLGIIPRHDHRFQTNQNQLTKLKKQFVYNDYKNPGVLKNAWKMIKATT